MAFLLPNSVFIHTPKTAGQWVASALASSELIVNTIGCVHASPDELIHECAFRFRKFVFTFVRHPAAWYQSMWAHRMDEEWEPIDDLDWFSPRWIEFWGDFTERCRSNSFEDFVRKCIQCYPEGLVSMLYESYTANCSFVGKQENLLEDLQIALDLAGEEYDSTTLRITKTKNVRGQRPHRRKNAQYSSDLLQLVTQVEVGAIRKYGYDRLEGVNLFV